MAETLKTIGFLVLLLIVLPVLVLSVVGKIRSRGNRQTVEEREAAKKRWTERLRHPQFEQVEKICGGALPRRLKLAYERGDAVLAKDVEFAPASKTAKEHFYWIQEFIPLDREGQKGTTDLSEFGRGCCFAGDGMGNFYWTPVSDVPQNDAPVYFACHDPWGNEKVADSLDEFFNWLKNSGAKSKN